MSARWLCGHGRHRWLFVSMTPPRWPDVPYADAVCDLAEQCRRCGLRRTRPRIDVPRRVRT